MNIILYKSETCPQCKILKKKMEQKGIAFTEETNVQIMNEKGITTIPQLEVDGVRYTSVKAASDWINAQEGNTNG